MSALTEKLVDFDIMVESEPRREPPAKPGQIAEQTSSLEESIFRLNGLLMNIKRTQKQCVATVFNYPISAVLTSHLSFHTRENRGFSIVKSTLRCVAYHSYSLSGPTNPYCSKLFWYAMLETLAVIGMAVYVYAVIHFSMQSHNSNFRFQVYVLQTFFTKTGQRYRV